jgi:hypothetical protein
MRTTAEDVGVRRTRYKTRKIEFTGRILERGPGSLFGMTISSSRSEQVVKHEDSRSSFASPYGTSSDEEKYYAATRPNDLVVPCGRDYDKLTK